MLLAVSVRPPPPNTVIPPVPDKTPENVTALLPVLTVTPPPLPLNVSASGVENGALAASVPPLRLNTPAAPGPGWTLGTTSDPALRL